LYTETTQVGALAAMRIAKTIVCACVLSGTAAISGSIIAQAEPGSAASYIATLQSGQASWYGPGFHGRRTANGERFNTNDLTAAHRTLPFGTKVRVTNTKTGQSVVVRINDRGPYAHGRVIDLSRASAQSIGIAGVAQVALAGL
jgi:rare lipoprotein A